MSKNENTTHCTCQTPAVMLRFTLVFLSDLDLQHLESSRVYRPSRFFSHNVHPVVVPLWRLLEVLVWKHLDTSATPRLPTKQGCYNTATLAKNLCSSKVLSDNPTIKKSQEILFTRLNPTHATSWKCVYLETVEHNKS